MHFTMRFILFYIIWFVIMATAYYYIGRRLVHYSPLPPKMKKLAWAIILFLFVMPQVVFLLFARVVENKWMDALSWFASISVGLFSLVFTLMILRDAGLLGIFVVRKIVSALKKINVTDNVVDKGRRQFLVQSTNFVIVGTGVLLSGYGLYEARRRADIEEVVVPIVNLPEEFEGFRIAQFTDIHIGPTIKRRYVEMIVEQLHGLGVDLIAFTGDLVDGSVRWLRDDVAPLKELTAPHGKFFVTGNHEYYSNAKPWIDEVARLGFDVLLNEHRILSLGNKHIILAGVPDYSAGNFIKSHTSDPQAAVANAPEGLVKILLAHQPKNIFSAAEAGFDLQISGHTHGGQFFPWDNLARLNQPYIRGLHKHGNTFIYVSRGTGYWGPPIRIGIPPEITVIKLTSQL